MRNKVCFVSVDVEKEITKMPEILDIFGKYGVSATLFVTGRVLKENRNLVKEWSKDYEIACHSFTHRFWSELNKEERKKELEDFINLYQEIFNEAPRGFRAPSHLIDKEGVELLQEQGFLYDSSILPHYPPLKKYRGYQGKRPLLPYYPEGLKILEIPVRGQIFGIPLAGAWLTKLPFWIYKILFFIYCPKFITLSWHSWDKLKNLDKILNLLSKKNYQFLNGRQIYQNYR